MPRLSDLPNPYDFANPVTDPHLFVGREKDLDEVEYYLKQGAVAPRPINLAILGTRASGKTSFLNMIEIRAKEKGFLVIRVNLDEADVYGQLPFFYKLFDSVLTSACLAGAFGGIHGKTYDTYRTTVDTHEIPDEKLFCPFVFPMQYAKAMGASNINALLSETNFGQDLATIGSEIQVPIILLLDECDVLTRSRVHLEKLRNIFMNLPGFMLVLTGSPELFPLMNDVFSPIIRQFKKIYLEPFKEQYDTKECIRKPLQKAGIKQLSSIFDFETLEDVREVHDVSGGRPYEIQLLSHVMFRRLQQGRVKKMGITIEVLEEVRQELESFQDVPARVVSAAIRGLDKQALSALNLLLSCEGYADFDQIWFAEYVFMDEERWKKKELEDQACLLQEEGLINLSDDGIRFMGDDFDRIYAKYYARANGVSLSFDEIPFEIHLYALMTISLHLQTRELAELELEPLPFTFGPHSVEDPGFKDVTAKLNESSIRDFPFKFFKSDIAMELYKAMIDSHDAESFRIVEVVINSPWPTVHAYYRHTPLDTAKESVSDTIVDLLSEAKKRALSLGGDLATESYEFPTVPPAAAAELVKEMDDDEILDDLHRWHKQRVTDEYMTKHNTDEAILHAELAHQYRLETTTANNFGYLCLVTGNLERARLLLEEAIAISKVPEDALPTYNLGVIDAKEGKLETALDRFNYVIDTLEEQDYPEFYSCMLVVPKISKNELTFEEVNDVDLEETAQSAASVVKEVLNAK